MFYEIALKAWLTLDSCYLIGWNQKKSPGDHGEWGLLHYTGTISLSIEKCFTPNEGIKMRVS